MANTLDKYKVEQSRIKSLMKSHGGSLSQGALREASRIGTVSFAKMLELCTTRNRQEGVRGNTVIHTWKVGMEPSIANSRIMRRAMTEYNEPYANVKHHPKPNTWTSMKEVGMESQQKAEKTEKSVPDHVTARKWADNNGYRIISHKEFDSISVDANRFKKHQRWMKTAESISLMYSSSAWKVISTVGLLASLVYILTNLF